MQSFSSTTLNGGYAETAITIRCVVASLLSGERYLAIEHSFVYENRVTEVRFIIASVQAWAAVIIFPIEDFWPTSIQIIANK